jgi:hypothetical protein
MKFYQILGKEGLASVLAELARLPLENQEALLGQAENLLRANQNAPTLLQA